MPDQQAIDQELERLMHSRRELAHYLKQQAIWGKAAQPFEIADGLQRARKQIQQTKALLRSWGVPIDDPAD